MKIKIVTDSASNMTCLEGVAFENVPLKINTDKKEYVDDASLNIEQMVEELSVYKGRSGTAASGKEAGPSEKEEKLPWAVRLCADRSDLQLQPDGKQPPAQTAGRNHLQERKGVRFL